jgi:hypothetical protein
MFLRFFKNSFLRYALFLSTATVLASCSESKKASTEAASRYLYVSTGLCYSGNNTTFTATTASNQIYRLDLSTGQRDAVIADYFASPANAGDSPVAIQSIDSNFLYVLVENATTTTLRRIERVEKKAAGNRSTFSNNTTALSAALRSLVLLSNGDVLASKGTAIEYLTAANARVGAPFISASAAPCNTSTTLIPKTLTLSNGKIVFLHAATGQNRFGIFNTSGGTTCAVNQAAPNANAFPTTAIYDSANSRLIVAYSGNASTTDLNSIYAYSINETTGAVTSPQKIYDASLYPATYSYLLYGISAMALDTTNGHLYIATAINNATTVVNYSIEKFTYAPSQLGVDNTKVLTRVGSTPFYPYDNDTRCISSMEVSD